MIVSELRDGRMGMALAGLCAAVRDGRQVLLRPVRAEDADRVQSFVRALSPQSRHSRFFGGLSELSPYLLRRLTRPARPTEFGLLALAGDPGARQVVGMAQYALEASCWAELGVVVADAWQRQGLGMRLIRMLGEHAARTGVRALRALTLTENHAVLALMRRLEWTLLGSPEPGLMQFEKPIARAAAPACISSFAL